MFNGNFCRWIFGSRSSLLIYGDQKSTVISLFGIWYLPTSDYYFFLRNVYERLFEHFTRLTQLENSICGWFQHYGILIETLRLEFLFIFPTLFWGSQPKCRILCHRSSYSQVDSICVRSLILFIACVRQHGSLFHDCIMFDKSIKLENVRCHVRLRLKQLRFQQLPLNVSQRSEHDLYFNIFEIKFSTLHNHILLLVSGAYFCGYVSNIVPVFRISLHLCTRKKNRKTAHNLLDVCACVFLKTFGLFVERPLFSLSTAKASLLTVAL